MTLPAAAVAAVLKDAGREIESEVCGSSMHPTLAAGASIRIRCGAGPYQPGDIVVFLAEPPIAHRVLARRRRGGRAYLIMRGDAHWICDAPVPEHLVLGVVMAHNTGGDWRPPAGQAPGAGSPLGSAIRWGSQRLTIVALGVAGLGAANLFARGSAWIARRFGYRR